MQQNLNGTVRVGNEVLSIARDADFNDLLVYGKRETQFRTAEALKGLCATFGEKRTPVMDLYRQRLHQMRVHLRMQ